MPSSQKRDLLIVLVTGVLTGIISPLVVNFFKAKALERQREHEEMVARDASIIQAQEKLLDTLSEQLLGYEFLAFKVSYYKLRDDEKRYNEALHKYEEESWSYFQTIRAQVYKSRRLVGADQYTSLENVALLQSSIDGNLIAAVRSDSNAGTKWSKFDGCLRAAMEQQTPMMLENLARHLQLSRTGLRKDTIDKAPSAFIISPFEPSSAIAGSLVEPSFDFDKCVK